MKTKTFLITLGLVAALGSPLVQAKENKGGGAKDADAMFVKKAAQGGMMEVELGKLAAEKGGSQEVKDFGSRMVKDHSKANDSLKAAAGKMNAKVPAQLNPKHKAMIDKMGAMSGADFDKAYVPAMVKDHEEDIAEFEKADKEVKSADLKKFIEETLSVMKEHLEMIKKFEQAKSAQ